MRTRNIGCIFRVYGEKKPLDGSHKSTSCIWMRSVQGFLLPIYAKYTPYVPSSHVYLSFFVGSSNKYHIKMSTFCILHFQQGHIFLGHIFLSSVLIICCQIFRFQLAVPYQNVHLLNFTVIRKTSKVNGKRRTLAPRQPEIP